MGPQQHLLGERAIRILQVKSIVHRTRRVILGRIQGGKVEEVFLDFGAIRNFEADRTEQRFDTLQSPRYRVQTTAIFGTAGQGHIKRFFSKARFQRGLAHVFAALIEGRLDGFLDLVDCGAGSLLLLRRQFAQALEEFGDPAALAKETGLDLLQFVRVGSGSERRPRFANNLIEIFHAFPPTKKEACASFSNCAFAQAPSCALAWLASAAKAG